MRFTYPSLSVTPGISVSPQSDSFGSSLFALIDAQIHHTMKYETAERGWAMSVSATSGLVQGRWRQFPKRFVCVM
jgi:hypothetical protein